MEAGWYLRKHDDGGIFGPLTLAQLTRWANLARIAPQDFVSDDQEAWMKAPMLSELGMDWLVEVTTERFYGPTTLGAVQEFLRLGEITHETHVINACDGSRRQIHQITAFFPAPEVDETIAQSPAPSGMAIDFEERIRDLERTLREERRSLQEAEARNRELEAKYQRLLASNGANG
ncbi:MAG: hypothetical protein M3R59_00155 [Verrucomicrobiota bacterium]|nr:hypothetical protein [Verrucomicrobiota bacterium]